MPSPPPLKRRRAQHREEEQALLQGLPDDLARMCLARVPAPLLYRVCRGWRRLLYSPSFPPFLSLYALLSSPSDPTLLLLRSYDPLSSAWTPLPSPPSATPLLHHPSFLSRPLPLQSLSTSNPPLLLLLAASSPLLLPALPRPLAFDPSSSSWIPGPAFPRPRRWCVSAADRSAGSVFLFSGLGAEYSPDVARSAERWDIPNHNDPKHTHKHTWIRLASMRHPRFCREPVDAVVARGKVYMASAREGEAYDVVGDRWEKMPPGMLEGWRGPAAAGEEEGKMYVAREGALWEYRWREDAWREVARAEGLRGAVQVAAGGGRVCAVSEGGESVAVVDARTGRVWKVDPPEGMKILAVHVLPRACGTERLDL